MINKEGIRLSLVTLCKINDIRFLFVNFSFFWLFVNLTD